LRHDNVVHTAQFGPDGSRMSLPPATRRFAFGMRGQEHLLAHHAPTNQASPSSFSRTANTSLQRAVTAWVRRPVWRTWERRDRSKVHSGAFPFGPAGIAIRTVGSGGAPASVGSGPYEHAVNGFMNFAVVGDHLINAVSYSRTEGSSPDGMGFGGPALRSRTADLVSPALEHGGTVQPRNSGPMEPGVTASADKSAASGMRAPDIQWRNLCDTRRGSTEPK
jgi:hypothetical protein